MHLKGIAFGQNRERVIDETILGSDHSMERCTWQPSLFGCVPLKKANGRRRCEESQRVLLGSFPQVRHGVLLQPGDHKRQLPRIRRKLSKLHRGP